MKITRCKPNLRQRKKAHTLLIAIQAIPTVATVMLQAGLQERDMVGTEGILIGKVIIMPWAPYFVIFLM